VQRFEDKVRLKRERRKGKREREIAGVQPVSG
jgi:hypothetical protein